MVVLSSPDVPGLRRFYRALGWDEQPGASDDLAMFALGGATLALHAAAASSSPPVEGLRSSPTLVVYVATREAVDSAVEVAAGAGASVPAAPTDQPWGGRSAVFADPEGHRWEVLWVPRASGPADEGAEG